jgi:pimeloyl-ACP methyl ester carboxylesterase
MKTILRTILLCISFSMYAQQPQTVEQILQQEDAFWQTSTAIVRQGINAQNGLPYLASGINYSRITPFTNLYQYNEPDHNTADARLFEQALSELYRASNKTKFVDNASYKQIKNTSASNKPDIQIGIINTDFDFLNYNEENESLGGLRLVNGIYQPIAGKPLAYTKHVTLIAPLNTTVTTGGTLTIGVNPQLFFNLDKKIDQINLDFGSGLVPIVKNQVATNPIVPNIFFKNGDLTIPFYVTYTDGSTLTTAIKINIIVPPSIGRRIATDCTIKTGVLPYNSKIPYQAWTETAPRYGKLEYKIFYANNNQTSSSCGIDRVKKPFVVIDGFDPGDKRKIELVDCDGNCQGLNKDPLTDTFIPDKYKSIYKLMSYKINPLDENEKPIDIVPLLQQNGFDVIVLNLPADRNPSDYSQVLHDYGADFIERNAMTFASFLKDMNASLKTRGITEQAVVVGPSMGGQITRYALAYMEKQQQATGDATWNHNTRLWVSMDSPHQGANVPLSIQGSTWFLGYVRGKEDVKKKFEEKLLAPATRQMLLEHWAEAISGTNPSSRYFTNYHANLDSNGLPNSKGYPMNLRKIAITNGSLSGLQEASPGQTALDMRGYIDFSIKILGLKIGWNINLFRSTQNYQYPYGSRGRIYNIAASALSLAPWLSQEFTRTTVNSLGSLDVVSGGLANSVNDFKEESIAALNNIYTIKQLNTTLRLRKDMRIPSAENIDVVPHAFIPTHSGLDTKGFANWHQPLNFNLVCTGQTPFESYFGEAVNRDHIFFTKESITWLLEELKGNKQAPSFPITQPNLLTGANTVCLNTNTTYSMDACKVPSPATWVVSPNLQIVSSTGYSITVKGLSNGLGSITATFQDGKTTSNNFWVGVAGQSVLISNSGIPYSVNNLPDGCPNYDNPFWTFKTTSEFDNVSEFIFTANGYTFTKAAINGKVIVTAKDLGMDSGRSIYVKVAPKNVCGTLSKNFGFTLYKPTTCECGIGPKCNLARISKSKQSLEPNSYSFFKIFPNPSSNIINISLFDDNNTPAKEALILAELYDLNSKKVREVTVTNNTATINVNSLPKGIYVLKINIDGAIESHQVVVE